MPSIFLGRTEEQERFVAVLDQLGEGRGEPGPSHVVLVQGLGGIGKSALLRRYEELVSERGRTARRSGPLLLVRVDWEDERAKQPDEYPGSTGPQVLTVAFALYRAAMDAVHSDRRLRRRAHRAFDGYRMVAEQSRGLGSVVDGNQGLATPSAGTLGDDMHGPLGAAAKAAAGIVPGGAALMPVAEAAPAAVASARRALRKRRHGRIDLLSRVRPSDSLAREFAAGLRDLSRHQPVVMLLDTYEIVAASGPWLRTVMQLAGERVAWVVAGRLEPEEESGPSGEVARFHRELPEDRLRTIVISRFTDYEVGLFLRHHLAQEVDDSVIAIVSAATRGVPLRVLLAVGMMRRGVGVDEVARPITPAGDSSEFVRDMATRYLMYIMHDPSLSADLPLVYGLALAHSDHSDPELVRALWGDVTDVAATLDGLATRHDFVQTESRRLHQEVRDVIRAYLLDAVRRDEVRAMNERAAELLRRRMSAGPSTVEKQLDDENWRAAATGLLWHEFWLDNAGGLRRLRDLLPAAALLQPSFAAEMHDVAAFFAVTLDPRQRATLRGLRGISGLWPTWQQFAGENDFADPLDDMSDASPLDIERATEFLTDADSCEGVVAEDLDPRALVELLLAEQWQGVDANRESAHLERAAGRLVPANGEIDEMLARSACSAARRLLFSRPGGVPGASPDAHRLMEIAVRHGPDDTANWVVLAQALRGLGRFDDALAALDRAGELGESSYLHNERGNVLAQLHRHQDSLAAYDRAIEIDGSDPVMLANRATALYHLRRHEEALTGFEDAIARDPRSASAHLNRGRCLHHLGRYDEALGAYSRALEIDNDYVDARADRVTALFDLDRYQEALDASEADAALYPENGRAHYYRGAVLHRLGRVDEALAAVERADSLGEDSANFHCSRAAILVSAGRQDEALEGFQRALSLDPTSAAGHWGRADVLLRKGRLDDARFALEEGLAHTSDRSGLWALIYLGALIRRDRPAEAEQRFREALADNGRGVSPFQRTLFRVIAGVALGNTIDIAGELGAVAHLRLPLDLYRPLLFELLGDPPLPGLDEIEEFARAHDR